MPRSLLVFLSMVILVCAPAAHAAFAGRATTSVGQLQYIGFGDVGGGVGSGRYIPGSCSAAGDATTCTLSGHYVETSASDHVPGMPGTFTLRLTYGGAGASPVTALSSAPGSDVLQFASGAAYTFTLEIMTAAGEHFTGLYPAPVFADSVAFSTFLDPATVACTGLATSQSCRVGEVGLVPGATITGSVNPFDFSIPGQFSVAQPVDVIEYYNASLDHYFITYLAPEIENLDAGRTPTRWTRTGYTFRIYASDVPGTSPVCRFYIPPGLGDSHFFGRGVVECDGTAAKFPALILEDPQFMHVALADGRNVPRRHAARLPCVQQPLGRESSLHGGPGRSRPDGLARLARRRRRPGSRRDVCASELTAGVAGRRCSAFETRSVAGGPSPAIRMLQRTRSTSIESTEPRHHRKANFACAGGRGSAGRSRAARTAC